MFTQVYTTNSKLKLSNVGGKALNLHKLIKNGFSVPRWFVITTNGYNEFMAQNQIELSKIFNEIDYDDVDSVERASKTISQKIRNGKLSENLESEIMENYSKFNFDKVAVRSSATAEDLQDASFAGQQDTYLNIRGIQILDYIKECYSSLWTTRAISYRNNNKITQKNVSLAVVIQEMISSKVSGVLFTANPVTMKRNQILIESNFGLGESIVSGNVVPDQFTIERTKINKKDDGKSNLEHFSIINKEISEKHEMVTSTNTGIGTTTVAIPENKRMIPSLDEKQLIKLASIAREVEKKFKHPQDIEWAIDNEDKIHFIQTRAITSLVSLQSEDDILFTRGYADDYWNDPVSPLFFDLLGSYLDIIVDKELNYLMGYPLPNEPLLRLSKGHVYFNVNTLKRKVEYEMPPFLRTDDLLNYFPEGKGTFGKETLRKSKFRIKARIRAQIRSMIADPDGSITKTDKVYEKWIVNEFIPFCDQFDKKFMLLKENSSLNELIKLSSSLHLSMLKHYRLIRYGMAVHNTGMNLATNFLLTSFLGKEKALICYPILISGLKHKTSETNSRLHHLAALIQADESLQKIFGEINSEELNNYLYERLNSSKAIKFFMSEYEKFMDEYGERGFTREPYYPRWGEKDGYRYVNDILKSLSTEKKGKALELHEIETKNILRRKEIEKYVEWKIKNQKLGIFKYKLFSIILNFARRYLIFRESQRFVLDRWIARNRWIYLEIGKYYQNRDLFEDKSDIFFLNRKEIKKIANKSFTDSEKLMFKTLIKRRKQEFIKYEHTTPPKFLQGTRSFNDIEGYSLDGVEDRIFKGIPSSQGTITAKVRILVDIKDISSIKAGEILIVPKTDPGWTPVFSKIGGLVTETGGVLSHGAVVAREYGIPAVTNVRNACNIFKDAKKVTIDGNTGIIRIDN